MTRGEAIAIIRQEYLCVDRNCDIERSCGKCDLAMPSKEPILEAYKMAIKALEQEPCENCISKKAVLDKINEICFSREQEAVDFRVSQGSNGQRDLIINFIENLPSVQSKPETEVLDKIKVEIDRQEKWLMSAGCNAYNVDIAFKSIRSAVKESEE